MMHKNYAQRMHVRAASILVESQLQDCQSESIILPTDSLNVTYVESDWSGFNCSYAPKFAPNSSLQLHLGMPSHSKDVRRLEALK
jgi:hypothetical protein